MRESPYPILFLRARQTLLRLRRMFSGCKDCQTSADVNDVKQFGLPDADGAGGACTNAMLLTLVCADQCRG